MTESIRVLIADDHPIVRAGLRGELTNDDHVDVVGEALNGDEALRLTRELQPDVLLLDVNMPGMKAVQVLKEAKRSLPDCRVLVLTAYGDSGTVLGMLKAGADGYLLKDEDPSVIHQALDAVARGETWLSQAVSEQMLLLTKENLAMLGDALTRREQQVLQRIVEGKSNVQIAQELSMSERTVEFHVGNLLQKLGVRNRVEAAVWGKEHGVV